MKLKWNKQIDPTTIPDVVILSEIGRRNNAKRQIHGAGSGRPPVIKTCLRCHLQMTATEFRKHNKNTCINQVAVL
jgi:hypothetical protein